MALLVFDTISQAASFMRASSVVRGSVRRSAAAQLSLLPKVISMRFSDPSKIGLGSTLSCAMPRVSGRYSFNRK